MEFRLSDIECLVEEYGVNDPGKFLTYDSWLNARYCDQYTLTGVHSNYYRLFYKIAELYKPRFVVELGSYWATAAAHFAAGCPTADVVTIDAHREIHPTDDVAWRKVREAADRYNNLQFIHGWTWDDHVIDMIRARPYPIDILFIDATHEYEHVQREWDLYSPMLADEALVIADDIYDSVGTTVNMEMFWNGLDYDKFSDARIHPPGYPMGFLRYVR